jgi:hypothetical protein
MMNYGQSLKAELLKRHHKVDSDIEIDTKLLVPYIKGGRKPYIRWNNTQRHDTLSIGCIAKYRSFIRGPAEKMKTTQLRDHNSKMHHVL